MKVMMIHRRHLMVMVMAMGMVVVKVQLLSHSSQPAASHMKVVTNNQIKVKLIPLKFQIWKNPEKTGIKKDMMMKK